MFKKRREADEIIEMVVNHKMNPIKPDELLTLAGQYQVNLNTK